MLQYRDENDRAFAQCALEMGYVTEPQLQNCLQTQEQLRGMGISKDLVEIMLDRRLITFAQSEAVRRAAGNRERLRLIGAYEILEELGAGGMGSVYKARHLDLGRLVALKVLKNELAGDPDFISRFRREARAVATLNHINIVHCYEVGREGDIHYMAMEFVDGENVGSILDARGAIGEPEALGICIQICRALQHAWEHGIVHRDIKPDNMLYIPPGRGKIPPDAVCGLAKLSDLGLARLGEQQGPKLTQTGIALGTPHYIAPEQASGSRDVDIRADIYSLGASLYHMVTGRTPYDGPTMTAIMLCHLTKPVPDPRDVMPSLSPATSAIVMRAMAKEPEERFQTPAEMEKALQTALETIGFQAPKSPLETISSVTSLERFGSTVAVEAVSAGDFVPPPNGAVEPPPQACAAEAAAAAQAPTHAENRTKSFAGVAAGLVFLSAFLGLGAFVLSRAGAQRETPGADSAFQPPPATESSTLPTSTPAAPSTPARPKPAGTHSANSPYLFQATPPAQTSEQSPKQPSPSKPGEAKPASSPAPQEKLEVPKQFEPALAALLKGDLPAARKELSRLPIKDLYSTHAEVIKCFIALKEYNKTGSRAAKTEAETAFGQLELHGGTAATPILVRILKDDDYRVRVDACRLLGKTGDPRAVEHLQSVMASDPHEAARIAARDALAALSGKGAGLLENIPLPPLR